MKRVHWPSVLQLGFSLVGTLVCWSFALMFALGGLSEVFSPQGISDGTVSFFLLAAGAGLSGLLLLPSAGYALARLLDRPTPWIEKVEAFSRRIFQPAWLPLLVPIVLLVVVALGFLVSSQARIAWFTLPVLHILAVGLPVYWLGYLGRRELSAGSNQRSWGIFGAGLILGPVVIMILEIAVLGMIALLGIVYITTQPALLEDLQMLAFRLQFASSDPEDIIRLLEPYLRQPLVLFTIFAFTSVMVPLIEEIFKPVGVWLLAGSQISPAEGFVAGLLSGTGYALFENLALTTINGGGWAEIVVSRIGTGLLHILTSGLTGWALALAWKEGRYLRLGLIYLAGVFIHGVWNSLGLLLGAANLSSSPFQGVAGPAVLNWVGKAGLALMTLGMFVLLLAANLALRRAQAQQTRSDHLNGVNYYPDRSDLTPG